MLDMFGAMPQKTTMTITAEAKWRSADTVTRQIMLGTINAPSCYVTTSWSKLPYLIRTNLTKQNWTACDMAP